ncbi:helix-turn-helix domain-containing protein [Gandjariella thermophila]|nr:helix-turn-helix transcriptional regulator [Gandjariella thermophila]
MAVTPTSGRSRALQLGAELREARKRAGMTVARLADALGYHHSTISRWERGESTPSEADTAAVLAILGITGEERDHVVDLARHDDIHDWVAPGIGRQLAALIEYERIAHTITEVAPLLIPGLLQTREYASSIMLGAGMSRGQAEQGAVVRLGRQHVLTRRTPVNFVAIIGELAVRHPACDNDAMVEQLHHLLTMAKRPNIDIRILPFDAHYTPALEGQFVLLQFHRDKPVVQLQSYWSASMITNVRAVQSYQNAVDSIRRKALSPEESATLIEEILKDMEKAA